MARLLVVTAVAAERDAILRGAADAELTVIVGGVGPAAAAAATAHALATASPRYELVLSAGIGGGFAPVAPGELAIATSIAFADLGAESPAGFVPVSALGFADERYPVAEDVSGWLAGRTGGRLGSILTVATVTGSATTAAALRGRFPDAVAEGMEGAGIAAAAQPAGIAFGEIRAISNAVGPRDRSSWQIPAALAALSQAFVAVTAGDWAR
jgi:futalosine hydrolase